MTHAQAPTMEEHMLGRQAKIVSPATLRRMLAYARQARQPKRNTVIVLLSVGRSQSLRDRGPDGQRQDR